MHPPSWYVASTAIPAARPALAGSVEADACVIGAGFTGLSAALHLAEAGLRVVVLEQHRIGWGASGRNGGQMVNGYSREVSTVERRHGGAAARALAAMATEGSAIIRERVHTYGIDCDLRDGHVVAAITPAQLRGLEATLAERTRHGQAGLALLDRAALARHVASTRYVGGLLDPLGGHLHPLGLALGEAAAVEARGGCIHEHSTVVRLGRDGARATAATPHGQVRARWLVLAGNAYLGGLVPAIAHRIMPVGTFMVATEPLGAAGAAALLPADTAIEDASFVLDYFRRSRDHRVLFGGGIRYGGTGFFEGGAAPGAVRAAIVRALQPRLATVFPELRGIGIDFAWGGDFALTLTRLPELGRLDDATYYAHGYSGHGVTTAHLAGRLIAEALCGDAGRFDAFAAMPAIPFPGGRALRVPLTRLGAWWYTLRDRLGR